MHTLHSVANHDQMSHLHQPETKRLFLAIDFPANVTDALAKIRPRAISGVRPTGIEQLHLTLHFIGEGDPQQIIDALQAVRASEFTLTISGVGQFRGRDNSVICWAGVKPSIELTELHRDVGDALGQVGFTPETRPFSPHITLARYRAFYKRAGDQATIEVERFLTQNVEFEIPNIAITEFRLYSSTAVEAGRKYECEHVFAFDRHP